MNVQTRVRLVLLCVAGLLVACGGEEVTLQAVLPGADAIPGWRPSGQVQVFDAQNLYDLVDGQADAFFAYAFEQVAVQSYEDTSGTSLRVEVWKMATAADAYGLFSTYRSGQPAAVGNEGDTDLGRRLDFWQDRYWVRLFAIAPVKETILRTFASAVSGALPSGGETPALAERLPTAGLVPGSDLFFHQEISIQDRLWLGGQNVLGLGPETDAVLARYRHADSEVWLLLVEYPQADAAAAALKGVQASGVTNLVTARVRDSLLGAVFGPVSEVEAQELLLDALVKH